MTEIAWVSTAPGHASNQRPLRNDIGEAFPERLQSIVTRNEAVEPLSADEFPQMVFGAPHSQERDYRLPDLFYGYGYWIVSAAAAALLEHTISAKVNFTSCRSKKGPTDTGRRRLVLPFVRQQEGRCCSKRISQSHEFPGQRWAPPFVTKDEDIAVSPAAAVGPDIWVDPKLVRCFFLSGELGRALKKARADKGFFLSRCRLVQGVVLADRKRPPSTN